jgi:hypothetical protein
MKRTILLAILFLSPFLFAQVQTCPTQAYLPFTGYEIAVDATKIAYDHAGTDPNRPAPQRLLVKPPVKVELGRTATVSGWACDPDENPMTLTAAKGTLTMITDGTWTLRYKPTAIGIEYINLTLSDGKATTTGTVVIFAVPANRPPVLCGGRS